MNYGSTQKSRLLKVTFATNEDSNLILVDSHKLIASEMYILEDLRQVDRNNRQCAEIELKTVPKPLGRDGKFPTEL